jgi:hypothetical protein
MTKEKNKLLIFLLIIVFLITGISIITHKQHIRSRKHAEKKVGLKEDNQWRRYVNEEMGFSLLVPKKVAYNETFVSVKTIEDMERNTVYLLPEAEKVPIESLTPDRNWAFTVKSVENDNELEIFIKEKFGSDCKLGKKELYRMEDRPIYNINIISGGMESNCPLNYRYRVLYAPDLKKVMGVILGQECGFSATLVPEYGAVCYDELIIDSFRFIK